MKEEEKLHIDTEPTHNDVHEYKKITLLKPTHSVLNSRLQFLLLLILPVI